MSPTDRVEEHTHPRVIQQIEDKTKARLAYYAANPQEIDERLEALREEWDIERTLEANSAVLSLCGLALGFTVNKRWFALPLAVQTFFLQHAIQGWCPPLPLLRRYGFRTCKEIEQERIALKALRGDFEGIQFHGYAEKGGQVEGALEAAALS